MKRIDVTSSADVRAGEIYATGVAGIRLILTRIDGRPWGHAMMDVGSTIEF